MKLTRKRVVVLGLSLLGTACTSELAPQRGQVGAPPTSTEGVSPGAVAPGAPSTPGGPSMVVELPALGALGPVALRRLNNLEYENTLRALGFAPGAASEFADDEPSLGYSNIAAALTVTPLRAEQYARAAASLAAGLDLNQEAPCAEAAPGPGATLCAGRFIDEFGKRAFRRPLTPAEVTAYLAIFEEKSGRSDYAGAIRLVAETMFQSPHFLYKTELGEGSGTDRALTSYELASQISYLVTGAPPDAELWAAAELGRLTDASERELQVRRLMTTPGGTSWLARFVREWLEVEKAGYLAKDQTTFPAYTPTLSMAVAEEASLFISSVLAEGGGSLQTLFTADWTLSNAELAAHYGLAQVPPDWQKVTLPGTQRMGILTQPAFLVSTSKAADSFPVRRGKVLRTRVLCAQVPPPPADLEILPVEVDPNLTTRERFQLHEQAGSVCASCHSLIDPLGFAFENYDATGAYRTTENNKPIDASGEIRAIAPEIDGPFANALEFTLKISTSQVLRDCVAREALRWSLGRSTLETPATDPNVLRDRALVQGLAERLGQSNTDIRELLVALVLRDEYGFRSEQ
jgi:hypothetical protein